MWPNIRRTQYVHFSWCVRMNLFFRIDSDIFIWSRQDLLINNVAADQAEQKNHCPPANAIARIKAKRNSGSFEFG